MHFSHPRFVTVSLHIHLIVCLPRIFVVMRLSFSSSASVRLSASHLCGFVKKSLFMCILPSLGLTSLWFCKEVTQRIHQSICPSRIYMTLWQCPAPYSYHCLSLSPQCGFVTKPLFIFICLSVYLSISCLCGFMTKSRSLFISLFVRLTSMWFCNKVTLHIHLFICPSRVYVVL